MKVYVVTSYIEGSEGDNVDGTSIEGVYLHKAKAESKAEKVWGGNVEEHELNEETK